MTAIPPIEELLRLQRAYYRVLSSWETRRWGIIGINLNNPTSHDSNHALLHSNVHPEQLAAILREGAEFYNERGVEPRVRYHTPPCSPDLQQQAVTLGWTADNMEETWRAWPAHMLPEGIPQVPGLTISLVGVSQLQELFAIHNEEGAGEDALRRRKVWAALASHPETDCLLASLSGEPAASLACVWNAGWGSIEDVRTREPFRRRGICTALLRFAQQCALQRGAQGLYLYDIEEGPDRVYARAGFEFVARLSTIQLTPPEGITTS